MNESQLEDRILSDVLAMVNQFATELYEKFADSIKIEEIKFNEEFSHRVGDKDFILRDFYPSTGNTIKISGKKKKKQGE